MQNVRNIVRRRKSGLRVKGEREYEQVIKGRGKKKGAETKEAKRFGRRIG